MNKKTTKKNISSNSTKIKSTKLIKKNNSIRLNNGGAKTSSVNTNPKNGFVKSVKLDSVNNKVDSKSIKSETSFSKLDSKPTKLEATPTPPTITNPTTTNSVLTNKEKTPKNLVQPTTVLLIILILVLVFFALNAVFNPSYKYSFNISGVDFVSNEFTPSVFFKEFKENDSFVLVIDIKKNYSNAWLINSMNLWLVALNADKKQVNLIVRGTSEGVIEECYTNEGNILEEKEISLSECELIVSDNTTPRIFVLIGEKDLVLLEENTLTITASSESTVSEINFVVIKEMYKDFEELLTKINQLVGMVV